MMVFNHGRTRKDTEGGARWRDGEVASGGAGFLTSVRNDGGARKGTEGRVHADHADKSADLRGFVPVETGTADRMNPVFQGLGVWKA